MKTLLFIDDDIGPLQFLVDIFEMKYNVKTAESIEKALKILSNPELQFDLIISDWHLGNDITAQDLFKALGESKYERYLKTKSKMHARLPDCLANSINVGDYVEIGECRPLSKIIHFVVTRKIHDKDMKIQKILDKEANMGEEK